MDGKKSMRKFAKSSVSQICDLGQQDKDGTCLAQLTLPSGWWPAFTRQNKGQSDREKDETFFTLVKQPKVLVDVKYSVFEMKAGSPCNSEPNEKGNNTFLTYF